MYMKRIKRFFLLVAVTFASLACLNSCGSLSTTGLKALELYDQSITNKGVYLGSASSYSDAQSLAKRKGYSRFDWYSTTGDVFGYD